MPADKNSSSPHPPGDDAPIDRVPDGDEAWRLLDAVLDGQASPAQRHRLEKLAVAHPAVARLCLRTTHLWYGLQLHTRRTEVIDEVGLDLDRSDIGVAAGGLNETMILPAVREGEPVQDDRGDPLLDLIPPEPQYIWRAPRPVRRWPWVAAAAAAATALGLTVWALRPGPTHTPTVAVNAPSPTTLPDAQTTPAPTPPVASQPAKPDAIMSAIAGAQIDGVPIDPGQPLTPGRTLRLTRGAVELTFASGAIVVASAPAQFRVSNNNAMELENGSLTAHVPHEAIGFVVQAPGLSVVDRGTNFGVRTTDGDAAAETAVFEGMVEASATDDRKQTVSLPVRLTAGQAVRHDVLTPGTGPAPISYTPDQYVRDITHTRVSLALHATGQNLKPGDPDPGWELVSVPGDTTFKPRPAFILATPNVFYEKVFPGRVWVCPTAAGDEVGNGDYVFRTTIDLTGYDPTTAQITAQAVADDEIVEIRSNGASSAVHTVRTANVSSYLLDISKLPWKAGPNVVDVVVRNSARTGTTTSPTGLSLNWTASACPLVQR